MLIIFDIAMLAMLFVNFRIHKKAFTVFSIFATIYAVLINLNNLIVCHLYDFYKVADESLLMLLSIFAVLFLIDVVFGLLTVKLNNKPSNQVKLTRMSSLTLDTSFNKAEYYIVTTLFFVGLAGYFASLCNSIIIYGIGNIKSTSNNQLTWLSFLAFTLAPLFIDKSWKGKMRTPSLISVGLLFAIAVIFGGKYVIMINAVYIILYFLLTKKYNFKFRKVILILTCVVSFVVLAFVVIYTIIPKLSGGETVASIGESVKHMFVYLLGPISGNNALLNVRVENGTLVPFTIPINIHKMLLQSNNYIDPILPFVFEYAHGSTVNVAGIITETVCCLGVTGGVFYLVGIFVIVNCFLLLYRVYGKYKLTTSYLLSVIGMSFFCNFFTVSGVVFPLILVFFMETGFDAYKQLKVKNNIKGILCFFIITLIALICSLIFYPAAVLLYPLIGLFLVQFGFITSDIIKLLKTNKSEKTTENSCDSIDKKLAVIILNYNGSDDTVECLSSLAINKEHYKIFVLDNGSLEEDVEKLDNYLKADDTCYAVKEISSKSFCKEIVDDETNLYYIKSKENLGFAKGNNFVVNKIYKQFDYVLLLNNDTVVPENTILSMVNTISNSGDVALTCDIRHNDDRNKLWSAGGEFKWYGDRKYYSQFDVDFLKKQGVQYIKSQFITGCALLVDCNYISEYGFLTEQFFHGEEDFNFCKNILLNGKTVGVDIGVQIYHKVGQSIKRDNEQKSFNKDVLHYTNRVIDMKNFCKPFKWKIWRRFYLDLLFVKSILSKCGLKNSKLIRKKVFEYTDSKNNISKEDFLEIVKANIFVNK